MCPPHPPPPTPLGQSSLALLGRFPDYPLAPHRPEHMAGPPTTPMNKHMASQIVAHFRIIFQNLAQYKA